MKVIERQIQRRRQTEEEVLADVWGQRLHETFEAARRGLARSEADDVRWTSGIGFLSQMNKAVESGLKMTGRIQGGGTTNVSFKVEQLVVLPQPMTTPVVDEAVIDLKPLPIREDARRGR
jgi:hypothetical protein